MEALAGTLLLLSIVAPFLALRYGFAVEVPSWIFNLLAIDAGMVEKARAHLVDQDPRLEAFWMGVLWLEYALIIVNFTVTLILLYSYFTARRKERLWWTA